MRLLDTNVVIRYLMGDHPDHSPRARTYFNRLHLGEERAMVIDGVVVEIVQVLSSKGQYYQVPRQDIAQHLRTILTLSGLTVQNRDLHIAALARYAVTSLDYVECLNIAFMHELNIGEIMSFDRDFDRNPDITRIEL